MRTPVAGQVEDVGGARAIDVGQPDAARVEDIGRVEPRRVVHADLGAEAAVAEVRPVGDLAIAHANDVGQPVAGEVGEKDRLRGVGEHDARAGLFVEHLLRALRRAEARLRQ